MCEVRDSWGTHSSPSRSSNRRRFWGILSCRCMFPTCIQRSSPLCWCTAHYVCIRHRRFRHLEKSNTDCLCDKVICGLMPGRGKKFFVVFKTLRPALGRILPPIRCTPVDFSRQVKRPGRETDSLPTASLPLTPLWQPQDQIYFLFVIFCLSLVNDTVSSSVYTVSNDWVIMEGLSCGR